MNVFSRFAALVRSLGRGADATAGQSANATPAEAALSAVARAERVASPFQQPDDPAPSQTDLLRFLLGGRTPDQVVADANKNLDEFARNEKRGLVLAQDVRVHPSGMVSGSMSPVWTTPKERDRQAQRLNHDLLNRGAGPASWWSQEERDERQKAIRADSERSRTRRFGRY
jgi:hypothetical protein